MSKTAALAAAFFLAACTATPPTQYYQLPDSAFRLPETRQDSVAVQMVLAEPLKSPSLLYQTDAHRLNFARKNLWAAPLGDSLAAAFANQFNRIDTRRSYLPAKYGSGSTPVLTVYLDRFQGSYLGETEISGYARHADGRRRSFHVRTPQQGDGYPAMIDSLSRGIATAAAQILN